jgi:hypothetical protein
MPAISRLRCGKCWARGAVPGGNSDTIAPEVTMRSMSARFDGG